MRLLSFAFCLSLALPASAAEPVQVLLLDYGAPAVNDALLGDLCVKPCRHATGCPDELIKNGVEAWSDDFVVYRPPYVGSSAAFVVRAFKDRGLDLISFAGEGSFDPWGVEDEIAGIDGAELFFTEPTLVLLNAMEGAPPELGGDPEAWLRGLADAGSITPSDVEPFVAALDLLAGTRQLYRVLFPNACLTGVHGSEEVAGLLSRLTGAGDDGECPLARGLASFLRAGTRSVDDEAVDCPEGAPASAPAFTNPSAAAPYARLFVELLWLDTGGLASEDRTLYCSELADRLGSTEVTGLPAIELRAWVHNPRHWEKLDAFVRGPLLQLSSFRQRDFFTFFASLRCGDCLELAMADDVPSILRENAAARLVPELGAEPYRRALRDPDPRVRHAAAARLKGADPEVLREASEHEDPVVRRLAARASER